jgi:uncharacterized membrane protein YfcA
VNAIAGGGTLLSFPLLLALGRDPLLANATNTVALAPGAAAGAFGFRSHLTGRPVAALVGTACVGSAAGAVALLLTPSPVFAWLVPWLIVGATILFAVADRLSGISAHTKGAARLAFAILLGAGFYGGYFGAGLGIITLAALGLVGIDDLHERNGIKGYLTASVNGLAAAIFIAKGLVMWSDALPMGAGAIIGGYLGAHAARRLGRGFVRRAVIVIGLALTAWYFVQSS